MFLGFVARKRSNPVCLPCLPAIGRKCLFPAGCIRRCDPEITYEDALAIVVFLIVKLTAPVLELADRGRQRERSDTLAAPVDAPLMRFGIVDAYGHTRDMAGRSIGLKFVHVAGSSKDRARYHGRIELCPFV